MERGKVVSARHARTHLAVEWQSHQKVPPSSTHDARLFPAEAERHVRCGGRRPDVLATAGEQEAVGGGSPLRPTPPADGHRGAGPLLDMDQADAEGAQRSRVSGRRLLADDQEYCMLPGVSTRTWQLPRQPLRTHGTRHHTAPAGAAAGSGRCRCRKKKRPWCALLECLVGLSCGGAGLLRVQVVQSRLELRQRLVVRTWVGDGNRGGGRDARRPRFYTQTDALCRESERREGSKDAECSFSFDPLSKASSMGQ